jgi:hypothetical protein
MKNKSIGLLCAVVTLFGNAHAASTLNSIEVRPIAKDAYVYGFPLVENYRTLYSYFVDRNDPNYKGAWNQIHNSAQASDLDTSASFLGADLRAEPLVLTIPEVPTTRYFSVQFIDLYTHNFAYLGTRATRNASGKFLLAGPSWSGKTPSGVAAVIRCETDFCLVIYRTQIFNENDVDNVKAIQNGYAVQSLSAFLGKRAAAATPVNFMPPLTPSEQRTSPAFFNELNFILQFCPAVPSEKETLARFAKMGVAAKKQFDVRALPPAIRTGIDLGIADAWQLFADLKKEIDAGRVALGQLYGTRSFLKNNYVYRMAGAVIHLYGNSKEEEIELAYTQDFDGKPLDAMSANYTLRFEPGRLPPVQALWSLTMYESPSGSLVGNPSDRHSVGLATLSALRRDADGGLTIYLQRVSPGNEKESNWLPAPNGPFTVALRLYMPAPEALDGRWTPPVVKKSN